MGNDFFRFKEFEVHQQKAAMKVCTDACLFGALLPIIGTGKTAGKSVLRALDIGTGTGLLSLMYAQVQPDCMIDALEIDQAAFEQAKENFKMSAWAGRLTAIQGDFRQFRNVFGFKNKTYDLIYANPPFFKGDLKSSDHQRNVALHSTDLDFEELIEGADAILKPEGIFAVLVHFARATEFITTAAAYKLYPSIHYKVANEERKPYFRSILLFSRSNGENIEEELFIRDANQEYSLKFKDLLRPFYLYL